MTICTLCALFPCRRGRLYKPAPDGPVRLCTARRQPSRPCTAHHPRGHQVSACCQLSFSHRSDIHRLSVCQIMVVPSGPSDLNSFADTSVARARGRNLHLAAPPAACSWLPFCVPCSPACLSVWHRVNPPASCSTFTNTQLARTCVPTHERGPVLTTALSNIKPKDVAPPYTWPVRTCCCALCRCPGLSLERIQSFMTDQQFVEMIR